MGTRYSRLPGEPVRHADTEDDAEKPDLVEVMEHYGTIVNRSMVHCPLHEDRTPSCSVNKGKGVFNCHSCGVAGDVWTLIMAKEGCDFDGARTAAALIGFANGSTGGGDIPVRVSAYGTRREVPERQGNRPGGSSYVPSWRSN